MFKWVKKLFKSEEVVEVAESVELEQEAIKEEEPQQDDVMDAKKILIDYVKFQQKLLSDTFVEMWREKYQDRISGNAINKAWAELASQTYELFEKYRADNPKRDIRDICIEICELKFDEINKRLEESVKKIVVEDVSKRFFEAANKIGGHVEVAEFANKVLKYIDALEAGEEAVQEAAATQEEPDELNNAIDSFVTSFNSKTPIPASEKEEPEELPIEEEESQPEVFLTDDERRFIEISEMHPEYAPVAIFNMIHREKQQKCC